LPGPGGWLALPVAALLFTPFVTGLVILAMLKKDDSIDGTIAIYAAVMALAVLVHLALHGVALW
jgi:hypothetical protein